MDCPDIQPTLSIIKEIGRCFELTLPQNTLEVVECPNNFVPNSFNITVSGDNVNPSNFLGPNDGTLVTLDECSFDVSESVIVNGNNIPIPFNVPDVCEDNLEQFGPFDASLNNICAAFSDECSGTISQGDNLECTIENFLSYWWRVNYKIIF